MCVVRVSATREDESRIQAADTKFLTVVKVARVRTDFAIMS